ncbi:CD4-1 molecule isoform 2-T2 [Clarias gariepinus]|uniref:CD4-1 molecule isoform X2 n=1 Tax=Clarias gariepinus TaxID=13013 RepID=UPI00234CCE42|nr:CD4-1 molecule isoform X2 [Clarias gariepinus]
MRFLLGLLLLVAPSPSAAEKEEEKVAFAQIGNSVTLPRTIWGAQDKIHVNWNFKNELLISRNPTSSGTKAVPQKWQGRLSLSPDYSLIILNFNETDFGMFQCEQHELLRQFKTTYKLYEVKMSQQKPLLAGSTLNLFCEIEKDGLKHVRSTNWLGPDNEPYNGRPSGNTNSLKVTNASRIHSGKWTCAVSYGDGMVFNAMTEVTIVDLAPSPSDPIYTSVSATDFSIPCSLSSKIPWSVVKGFEVSEGSWNFTPVDGSSSRRLLELHPDSLAWKVVNDMDSSLKGTEVKNHVLDMKISKVSIKDRGTYTCSLKFKSITLSRSVTVEVLQVASSGSKVVYEGDPVNLTCSLGHSMIPDLEVNWIPPYSLSLSNHSYPHTTVLSFPESNVKNSGRWTCQLKKNGTVLTSASVSIKIVKAPVNVWLVVAIVGGVLVFVLLAAITVIIFRRRRKVMKYTRRKRKFCRCKNPQPKGFYKT